MLEALALLALEAVEQQPLARRSYVRVLPREAELIHWDPLVSITLAAAVEQEAHRVLSEFELLGTQKVRPRGKHWESRIPKFHAQTLVHAGMGQRWVAQVVPKKDWHTIPELLVQKPMKDRACGKDD